MFRKSSYYASIWIFSREARDWDKEEISICILIYKFNYIYF